MMGRSEQDQGQLFYSFCLEEVVPDDHQVRAIASVLDLSWVYGELSPHYPALGRPSVDPVLMIRMLILGSAFGLRSERLLCREVRVNLAYRWFCGLSMEDKIPDHSVFSRARNDRYYPPPQCRCRSRARASLRNWHQVPSSMGFEEEAEQSFGRPCRQSNGRSKQTYELTSSIVPRGTSFHRSAELHAQMPGAHFVCTALRWRRATCVEAVRQVDRPSMPEDREADNHDESDP